MEEILRSSYLKVFNYNSVIPSVIEGSCSIMKKIISVISFLLFFFVSGAQQLDSLTEASLSSKVKEYFDALKYESLETQMAEADFMIELSPDSLIRNLVANEIYGHYADSPVMGAENVAVHVFDRWFSDGKVRMNNEMDFLNARMFAEFNRSSLIGKEAPSLVMEAMDGSVKELFTSGRPGKYHVLFFYDTACSKCKVETILLRNHVAVESFPVEYHAIYAGDDRKAWEEYVAERFVTDSGNPGFTHLWDPSMASDFQQKYGVMQTPRMFLVDPDGVIVGRGLDTRSLSALLHSIFDEVELNYGGDESVALYDQVFLGDGGIPIEEDVRRIADYVESSTLGASDTIMFRQLTGDLLYYLSAQQGEAFKEGMAYLIDEKILSRNDVWRSADDSLKVIGMAQFMDELLDKAEPGTKIAAIKVPSEQVKRRGSRMGKFRLDRLHGKRNIIIFYTEGCHICDAEKDAARRLAESDRDVRVLLVNVDRIMSSDPSLANRLFDAFDLSTLPFVVETDRQGLITHRYITLQ